MLTSRMKIEGPGGTFDFEVEIIRRALAAEGVSVTIQGELRPVTEKDMDEYRQRMKDDWNDGNPVKRHVVINIIQHPWGG